MICGFIGTGTITATMVEGLAAAPFPFFRILVAPRNPDIAAGLATRFDRFEEAASRHAVADRSDLPVLALRP
jgi:pyrroline-5-carboxylate reductase